jgi:hypothetical protein
MLSKAMIQKAGNAAKRAVEKALAGKSAPKAKQKSGSPKKPSRSAYDEASEMGPFKGDTLPNLIRAAQKTGVMSEESVERYRRAAASAYDDKSRARTLNGFRNELKMYGVRFV